MSTKKTRLTIQQNPELIEMLYGLTVEAEEAYTSCWKTDLSNVDRTELLTTFKKLKTNCLKAELHLNSRSMTNLVILLGGLETMYKQLFTTNEKIQVNELSFIPVEEVDWYDFDCRLVNKFRRIKAELKSTYIEIVKAKRCKC